MKIKFKEVLYFGYRQGFKIFINGIKYPLKRGFYYTSMTKEKALSDCLAFDFKG